MSPIDAPEGVEICPVCGARGGRPVHAKVRDPITLEPFRIVECAACGVVYTGPRPLSLERYYPERYRGYGPLVTRILGFLYDLRVARWVRLEPAGGSVLEIGCGPGLMLAAFRRRGWRVLGIERNAVMADEARRTHGVEVVTTPVEALPSDARFDLIVMFNALEHIGEPVELLRECAGRLTPGGRLIVSLPNFASWQSRFAGPYWLHLDPPRHLVHFTPRTLAATLERAGLTLVETRFVSLEHDPYGWVESTIGRLTGRANTLTRFLMGLDPWSPAVLLSFLLGALLAIPAVLLAVASWLAGSGALMEVTAAAAIPRDAPASDRVP